MSIFIFTCCLNSFTTTSDKNPILMHISISPWQKSNDFSHNSKCSFSFTFFRYTVLGLSIPLNTRTNTDNSPTFIVNICLQLMDVSVYHVSCLSDTLMVLINAEKHRFAVELSEHSVARTSFLPPKTPN